MTILALIVSCVAFDDDRSDAYMHRSVQESHLGAKTPRCQLRADGRSRASHVDSAAEISGPLAARRTIELQPRSFCRRDDGLKPLSELVGRTIRKVHRTETDQGDCEQVDDVPCHHGFASFSGAKVQSLCRVSRR